MIPLRSITFHYESQQDRILAAINVEEGNRWSCWLTRRMTLAALDQIRKLVERTSELGKKADTASRPDVFAFEREAALVNSSSAVRSTPRGALKISSTTTECANRITVAYVRQKFRLEIEGSSSELARALIDRPLFQRIICALEDEVVKADWVMAREPHAIGVPGIDSNTGSLRH